MLNSLKKLIILTAVSILFLSCANKPQPIEKYQGKGFVVINEPHRWDENLVEVICKTKDSIFSIYLTSFDAKGLKVGDTIK